MIAEMIHILRITKLTDHDCTKPTKINNEIIINIAVHSYLSNFIKEPLFIQNELLEDCALYKNTNSEYQCNNLHSCDFLNKTIGALLNKTLGKGKLNKRYEFKSYLLQNQNEIELIYLIDEGGRGCRKKDTDSSGAFPLPTNAGQVISILKLCD